MYTGYIHTISTPIPCVFPEFREYLGCRKVSVFPNIVAEAFIYQLFPRVDLDCSLVFIAGFICGKFRNDGKDRRSGFGQKTIFFRKSYNFYLQTLGMFVQVCKTLDLYRSKVLRILRNHAHVNKIGWISMSGHWVLNHRCICEHALLWFQYDIVESV